MTSLFMLTAMLGYAYHLPPLLLVAAGSSTRPASSASPLVFSFTHCAAVCVSAVGPPAGRPTVCAYQMALLRKTAFMMRASPTSIPLNCARPRLRRLRQDVSARLCPGADQRVRLEHSLRVDRRVRGTGDGVQPVGAARAAPVVRRVERRFRRRVGDDRDHREVRDARENCGRRRRARTQRRVVDGEHTRLLKGVGTVREHVDAHRHPVHVEPHLRIIGPPFRRPLRRTDTARRTPGTATASTSRWDRRCSTRPAESTSSPIARWRRRTRGSGCYRGRRRSSDRTDRRLRWTPRMSTAARC